jgi:hypothetical protein
MSRVTKTRKPETLPSTPLEAMMGEHLRALAVQNYSAHTVRNRQVHIGFFLQWCKERGLTEPARVGAVSASSVPLPQKEWRALELPFAALVPGPVARVVPVDDAPESHPA